MARNVITVRITGGAELRDALENKPRDVAKKIVRSSLKEAAGIWREEMQLTAPRGAPHHAEKGHTELPSGFLADHIGMTTRVNGDELSGVANVGPTKKAFWGLFEEFGTADAAPRPFIRSSYESRKQDVLDKFIASVRELLGFGK